MMLRRLIELLRDLPDSNCSGHEAYMRLAGGQNSRRWGYLDALGLAERRAALLATTRTSHQKPFARASIQPKTIRKAS